MGTQSSPVVDSLLWQTILANVRKVERERELFQPEPYFRIEIVLKPGRSGAFTMPLCRIKTQKNLRLSEPVAKAVVLDLKQSSFKLQRFEKIEKPHPPAKPITETEIMLYAAIHWKWAPQKTSDIINHLLHSDTPKIRLGVDASLIDQTRLRILSDYGKEYLPRAAKRLPGSSTQAILAPQDVNKTPKKMKRLLSAEELQLYQLIYNRFIAWQTSDAQLQKVTVEVIAGDDNRYQFERKDIGILFRGYMQIYEHESDVELRQASYTWDTELEKRESLRLVDINLIKEKTSPPPRFSIEAIDKGELGERSEVQLAIAQLIAEDYLSVNGQGLETTEKGRSVPLPENQSVSPSTSAEATVRLTPQAIEMDGERISCPKCGKRLVLRQGPYGRFWACSGYPACHHTQPIKLDIPCPQPGCNGHLVQRRSHSGQIFYGCSEYPRCRYTQKP